MQGQLEQLDVLDHAQIIGYEDANRFFAEDGSGTGVPAPLPVATIRNCHFSSKIAYPLCCTSFTFLRTLAATW